MKTRPYEQRARAEGSAATAARIREAALARFAEEAYEDVSLDALAEDAGVSVRTVLRRFGSKEGLFAAAAAEANERVRAFRDQAPVGDVPGAVANVVEHYERWGDAVMRVLAQEERVPAVRGPLEDGRTLHREWVERTLAPRDLVAAIAATDVYVWKLLRRDLGLGVDETRRTMERLLQGGL